MYFTLLLHSVITNHVVLAKKKGKVLGQTIEVFVPLCYAVTFSLAYLGPNAGVLGNVSSL